MRANRLIEEDERPIIQKLTGGVSNRTVLVRRVTGPSFVIKQALSKLRVEADWFSNPERIHREALALRWFEKLAPSRTTVLLLFEDVQQHVIAMTAVPDPHRNWKTMLLEEGPRLIHLDQFATILATLHENSYRNRRLLSKIFRGNSNFESLRLEPYYRYSAETTPAAAPFLSHLVEETLRSLLTIVHGDYSPKNILVHDERLVLLDLEVVHFGDPAFDIGFSLTHLLSKAHHCSNRTDEFIQAAHFYVHRYSEIAREIGRMRGLESRACRHCLGCLLARVVGRSPLEYLTDQERISQKEAVLSLISDLPCTLDDLITRFSSKVNTA